MLRTISILTWPLGLSAPVADSSELGDTLQMLAGTYRPPRRSLEHRHAQPEQLVQVRNAEQPSSPEATRRCAGNALEQGSSRGGRGWCAREVSAGMDRQESGKSGGPFGACRLWRQNGHRRPLDGEAVPRVRLSSDNLQSVG